MGFRSEEHAGWAKMSDFILLEENRQKDWMGVVQMEVGHEGMAALSLAPLLEFSSSN